MNVSEPESYVIQILGLAHYYKRHRALDDFSLSVSSGETIALIGADGVGKSTLLGLIAGTKRIQTGSVRVFGADYSDYHRREEAKGKIAYMRQGLGHGLYQSLSVLENISFTARLFGISDREVVGKLPRLLDATGLSPFKHRQAKKLSGGMKQKLQLCCCLIHSPDLLILDEPTTGVDPLSRQQFWALVDELRLESPGMTLVAATAYIEEATKFDRLILINAGKTLITGHYQDVLLRTKAQSLEEAYTKLLSINNGETLNPVVLPPALDGRNKLVIEATGLSKKFRDFVAVDNVDINISIGEIFGFLGPNGCGKTTTMKMLTGLLSPTCGTAKLFGKPIAANDMASRRRVGYMSQTFSLYQELTVSENLRLHATIYCDELDVDPIIRRALIEFELEDYAQSMPMELPLGIRQRLQLAATCLHEPEILILDEPTSGVDPLTRERFWHMLMKLSRKKNVTIFISTHFMNEAEWCDRISLMNNGRLLAMGSPSEIMERCGAASLEEAFIWHLQRDLVQPLPSNDIVDFYELPQTQLTEFTAIPAPIRAKFRRIFAFAACEFAEIARKRARLAFALLGPSILLWVAAYAISFDIGKIEFAGVDLDQTGISRDLLSQFSDPYFHRNAEFAAVENATQALVRGGVQMVVEIPPGFGRAVIAGQKPEVSVYIDGSKPFVAFNARAYAAGVVSNFVETMARESGASASPRAISIQPRFSYNQDFRSIVTIVPGFIMVSLTLFPTMMTALGIVREKEIGTISNLYSSPGSMSEFLIGKQIPHVFLAMAAYFILIAVAAVVVGVSMNGSLLALSIGAFLFIVSVTAFGLLISAIATSQVAAIFGTAIICLIIAMNYSGLLFPISTLSGGRYWVAVGNPASWFNQIALGCFSKGLSFGDFQISYLVLMCFSMLYFFAARAFLSNQEK